MMRFRLFAYLAFALWLGLPAQAAPLHVVLAEYPPYSFVGADGQARGIEVDILREALFRRMQVPLLIEILPWARAQRYVEQGAADALVAYPSDRRRQYTVISAEPVADWGVTLYAARNGPLRERLAKVGDATQLGPFRLGVTDGNNWAEESLKGMAVEHTPTVDSLLKMLVSGRIDAIPDSPPVVRYYLRELNMKADVVELGRLATRELHLCIGKQSTYQSLMPRFDATIKAMRQEGTLAKLTARYE